MQKTYYALSVDDATSQLKVNPQGGLTNDEAAKRLETYGENKLTGKKSKTIFKMFLEQFKDFLVIILLVAAVVSILMNEVFDGTVILAIVVLNAVLGVYQENKADNALKALKAMASPKAKVLRSGTVVEVSTEEIVPGDIVQLDAGDYVPADVRLIEAQNLKIDESALTGESVPSEKDATALLPADAPLGDRKNCGYMSSVVTYGRGKGLVVATAMETEVGKIATILNDTEDEATPLQKKLNDLGKLLGIVCLAVCAMIFVLGWFQGMDLFDIFMVSISLAVAAVPEGLTVVVTVILAMGMQKMVKSHAIIKRLSACETLGSTTVICSDKTGTLTQNKMTVTKLYTSEGFYEVTGTGYDAEGAILKDGTAQSSLAVESLLKGVVLCNDASFDSQKRTIVGDPTEGALLVVAAKAGFSKPTLESEHQRLEEIPFDSDRKLMSTVNAFEEGAVLFTKGAPDELLSRSTHFLQNGEVVPLDEGNRSAILAANHQCASEALRVLGVGYKRIVEEKDFAEDNLIFLGLLGMIDPPREEAKAAIATCKTSGIKVKMITGDHKITASAIGKQLGILTAQDDEAIEGKELNNLTDAQLKETVQRVNVYARVSPEHKVRIVSALRDCGEIAAMTGDGVNDAPSLKRADIGIAMGITGTAVSKEAADMILTDDNFASIVLAVEEGRTIYNNIRKVVSFLLSCNIGEILVIFVAMLAGMPVPLAAIQLLTINLVTDAFPAFALGMEDKEAGIMEVPPRDPQLPIVDKNMRIMIAFQSVCLAVASLSAFAIGLKWFKIDAGTMCFTTLVFGELFRTFSVRFEKEFLLKSNIFGNKHLNITILCTVIFMMLLLYVPPLNRIFLTTPLGALQLGICAVLALLPTVGGETAKLFIRKKK